VISAIESLRAEKIPEESNPFGDHSNVISNFIVRRGV